MDYCASIPASTTTTRASRIGDTVRPRIPLGYRRLAVLGGCVTTIGCVEMQDIAAHGTVLMGREPDLRYLMKPVGKPATQIMH